MGLSCFKAYDIRGRIPDELNAEVCWTIGRAYAEFLKPRQIVVGRDVRLSSSTFCQALTDGLLNGGVDVIDIGLCGTEEVYFATVNRQLDGGIMVTASHNPLDYNGMKLVRADARPISGDSGLDTINKLVSSKNFTPPSRRGAVSADGYKQAYIEHLLTYIEISRLPKLKIVVNAGNGCAGPIIDLLEQYLPFEFIKINHQPDGTFPNGIPNPLLQENRAITADAVRSNRADVGIAWDGDFDRCFFFDENGSFIEGYYIVGLLASVLLKQHPGGRIIHDPRLTWNTIEMVEELGGIPVMCKTGHAFIKERMRAEDAIYGGEMSAHHYFRDFSYCDSGMIPWLLIMEIMGRSGKRLSHLVAERMALYPVSGEINLVVENPQLILKNIEELYKCQAKTIDYIDGLSMEFSGWRFNLRSSNTEQVLRLNIETQNDINLLKNKTNELFCSIKNL